MRRCVGVLVLGSLLACKAEPVMPTVGAQAVIIPESIVAPPGTLVSVDIFVYDATTSTALNNVYVDINAYGATVMPAGAIVGYGSSPDDPEPTYTEGECQTPGGTTWCDGFLEVSDACDSTSPTYDPQVCETQSCLPNDAYFDCLQDYYYDPTDLELEISPTFARLLTDERGVAHTYLLLFCAATDGGRVVCQDTYTQGEDGEPGKPIKLEGFMLVSLGSSGATMEYTYQAPQL